MNTDKRCSTKSLCNMIKTSKFARFSARSVVKMGFYSGVMKHIRNTCDTTTNSEK